MRLQERTIVVTGAGSGIGAQTCRSCLAEGARVFGVDRDGGALADLATSLTGHAGRLETVEGDVLDTATIATVMAAAGTLHGLVTAAGISESGVALTDIDPDTWDRIFAVNVKASWLWMRAAVPAMATAGTGSIVLVASQLAFGGGQLNAAYVASKGAIVSLAKTAGMELAPKGIRVNAVAPGAIDTPMLRRSFSRATDPEQAQQRSRSRHAMARFGQPGEIANGIVFLLSDESSFSTGTTLMLDGGWTAA